MSETERCKEIVERKIDEILERRKTYRRKNRLTYLLNQLKEDIFFLIDNPDYIRKSISS